MHVVSAARKLIFRPRSDRGATVVSFPPGAKISTYGVNNETPTVVVRNATEEEPSWQGVDHDSGVVIVNEVSENVANTALDIFEQSGRTYDGLMQALYYLASSGYGDQYTASLSFVDNNLSPAGRMLDKFTGIVKRDDRDMVSCWRREDTFYVVHDGESRVIDPDILVRTYRTPDGGRIDLDDIPVS